MATTQASHLRSSSTLFTPASRSTLRIPGAKEKQNFEVFLTDDDSINPKTWSRLKRWYLTCLSSLLVVNSTFASSAPSSLVQAVMHDLHMAEEVTILMISLFLAGYCVGPFAWGPLSEQFGRRPIFVISFFVYSVFQIGCALSKTPAQLLVLRFIGGMFAAAPLTNTGALIADIWDANTRGKALAIFTVSAFAGPALGPAVSGFTIVGGLSWHWTFWIMACFAGACWTIVVLTLPETYAPILTIQKARRLRKETGDSRYYAAAEKQTLSISARISTTFLRPFKIMFREPMLIAITVYMSFIYGCIYLLFEAYPIVFIRGHHFNLGIGGLMFLPIAIGGAFAVAVYLLVINPRYEKAAAKYAPRRVPPEFRLEIACIAAPLFAGGFFWFAWTSYPGISYWAPMMAGGVIAFGICWIFLALFSYMIDAYLWVSASALAGNTVVRSLCGAGFPLFATQMYNKLGNQWASSLLGFIALAMTPIPFVLMKFGPKLRKHSKYAPNVDDPQPQPVAEVVEEEVEREDAQSYFELEPIRIIRGGEAI